MAETIELARVRSKTPDLTVLRPNSNSISNVPESSDPEQDAGTLGRARKTREEMKARDKSSVNIQHNTEV